ncbi:hypothetical protein [Acidomonas methanolica]|uniref:Uncharacterized protein n=1 Tax=Acidomonas methanolica NBRC 104435 TaxID=1231351 RepID=A0A023D7W7_ACIMT|nr:hypothetical protein [Acidomonas methanolica]TCS23821.1 hypothetical protein EDC31_12739 [Acidomonas methanolica]GAJ29835.1 hypothetical protein Amme_083_010 [Acidomonas methanolica NBRC 104435]GBQ52904.1 hypothetical protein AA0498_1829 [Acidomonas methanolica]GEL00184.1 hypothetical protein AME01nite_26820 [Acidomonas methanolica NBRC 104435]
MTDGTATVIRYYKPAPAAASGWVELEAYFSGRRMEVSYLTPSLVWDGIRHHRLGKDAFETPEEAAARAREMRRAKIDRLRKQIIKLEGLGV